MVGAGCVRAAGSDADVHVHLDPFGLDLGAFDLDLGDLDLDLDLGPDCDARVDGNG